ncbi:hypothetical protein DRQ25_15240 [Candidatus Fermentibacteria bacterium]|nr:MAG: hypothetical protein DRQ25_15240 [Candidatus Fermentibacteria bacterium]
MASKELPHIFLKKPPDVLLYKGKPGRSPLKNIPSRNWKTHGKLLQSQLQLAIDEAKSILQKIEKYLLEPGVSGKLH